MIKYSSLALLVCCFTYSSFIFFGDEFQESIKRGETIYATNCANCHMSEGDGIEGAFPPLAKSDYLMADKNRSINILLKGLNEKIVVNEKEYTMAMPKMDYMSDRQIADVLNFVRNSWGNEGEAVSVEEVNNFRELIKNKN